MDIAVTAGRQEGAPVVAPLGSYAPAPVQDAVFNELLARIHVVTEQLSEAYGGAA